MLTRLALLISVFAMACSSPPLDEPTDADVAELIETRFQRVVSTCRPRTSPDEIPRPLVRVPPKYPDAAFRAGIGGRVLVEAELARSGRLENVRVIAYEPSTVFNAVTLEAVRQWRYCPLKPGEPDYQNPIRVAIPFSMG